MPRLRWRWRPTRRARIKIWQRSVITKADARRPRRIASAPIAPQPLIIMRAAHARRRVLTLASAARANSPDRYLIPPARYDRLTWFIDYADEARGDPRDFDVVFNAIADPDAAATSLGEGGRVSCALRPARAQFP